MPRSRRAASALLVLAATVLGPAMTAGRASATNDPFWSRQWAPAKIGAPSAWPVTTGAGVKIGIVDSGVDLAHQDLAGKIVANASCINTQGSAGACVSGGGQDINGHGTHVAGIAAAIKDNGVGTAGIAPSAQLVVARVFTNDSANLADVEAGIRWVVDQGARVVNLSLGENVLLGGLLGGGGSLGPVLNEAYARGAIPVVAAGNAQLLSGSASYGNVNAVIVGATGPDDEIAAYSVPTGNAKWALVAPGGNGADTRQIFSTYWQAGAANQYGYLQGTSMATPHVSGSLALLLARPGMTQQRAVELLLASANRAVSCGSTCVGRLDVGAAVAATGGASAPPPPPPGTAAPSTGAATTPAPRAPRATAAPSTAAATTTAPPPTAAPDTTAAPATAAPETTVVTSPADQPAEALRAVAAEKDDEPDVTVPGSAAGLLLVGAGIGAVVTRRRTG